MLDLEKLLLLGKELHFVGIGALEAREVHELVPVLQKRAEEKRKTPFEEQVISSRVNPFLLMKCAKSIIVTATSYADESSSFMENKPLFAGELARFARGLDYHQVVHQQLKALAEKLNRDEPDLEWRAFVDTGPLVDRYLAAQAGIGVYGKNNCLIIPGTGSYVVLGYLIINKPVQDSVAEPQRLQSCDGCGQCQKSCPSNALEVPYQVRPDRCLSCLLQQKENIPQAMRTLMGQRVYGCDICQAVCPHNQQAAQTKEPMMFHIPRSPWIDLVHLLTLSNRGFNRLYRSSAFGWRGHRIMQRNALMALGNANDKEAVKHIKPFTHHQREELGDMARWALRQHMQS